MAAGLWRSDSFVGSHRPVAAGGDGLAQGGRLRGRLNAQLVGQEGATGFVLGQRGGAVAGQGEGPHQLAVGRLAPRLQGQLAAGMGLRLVQPAGGQVILCRLEQRFEG